MTDKPSATVIADSVSPEGHRLTTFQVTMHRFVLAEFNTHRVFSRNSASSRAIPVERQLQRILTDPAFPLEWPSEKPGMQGGVPLEGEALNAARWLFEDSCEHTVVSVNAYLSNHPEKPDRLHKSLVNRLMEPFQWHTAVITATGFENFFRQRVSPLAQPEIRVPAEMMLDAYKASTPTPIEYGDYHLPYIRVEDIEQAWDEHEGNAEAAERMLVQVSSARCARVSYLTQDGRRDLSEDLTLYNRLIGAEPMHASPLEHVATPAAWNIQEIGLVADEYGIVHPVSPASTIAANGTILTLPRVGNFLGWQQHRLEIEMTRPYQFFA